LYGADFSSRFGEKIEIYAESSALLYIIFGLSFAIAVYGFFMNKLNEYLIRKKDHIKHVRESIVFANRKKHHAVGYNGGSYHVYFRQMSRSVSNTDISSIIYHIRSLEGASKEKRIREIETLVDQHIIEPGQGVALSILCERIEKEFKRSEECLQKYLSLEHSDFYALLSQMVELLKRGDISKMKNVYENAFVHLSSEQKDSSEQIVLLDIIMARANTMFCKYSDAENFYDSARAEQEGAFGKTSEIYVNIQDEHGYVLYLQGRYKEAILSFKDALSAAQRTLRSNHPNLGVAYNALGLSLLAQQMPEKAMMCFEKALTILIKALLDTHPSVSATYANMAEAFEMMGDNENALKHFEEAIKRDIVYFGKNHLSIGIYYHSIGMLHYKNKKYDFALKYFTDSLEIKKKVLGEQHPLLASAHNNIGRINFFQKQFDAAEEHYKKALWIGSRMYGEIHPDVAMAQDNIGGVLKAKGHMGKSIFHYQKALSAYRSLFGEDTSLVAVAYDNLAGAYREKGDFQKAIDCYDKAIRINYKIHGESHKDVASCYNGLAKTYRMQQQYDRSIEYHQKAIEVINGMPEKTPADLAKIYDSYAETLYAMGNISEARRYFSKGPLHFR
jgi:tetratricopeptide (TPR) repeat protein